MAPASDFTATIDWGDGTTTAGSIVLPTTSAGLCDVTGDHTYASVGSYATTITVTDNAGDSGSSTGTASVAAPVLQSTGLNVAATEGAVFEGIVASVVDSQPGASSGELSAIIDWGNGDTSIGLVTAAPEGGGLFDVLGSEVYTSAATFPITVQITDATGEETTASGTAAVAGAALTAYPLSVAATEGQNFNGAVVTVLDANLSAVAADFNAQINWGDGTTGPGTVTAVTGTPGRFVVTGSHTYTEAGLYNLVIALSDRGAVSATATATATAQVADSPLSLADATLHAVAGTAFASTVGTLTDPNPYAVAADFTATIRWGDGTSSIGSVAADPEVSGRFEVTGTHAYAENGAYAVIVQVVDRGGATSFTVSSTTVSPASIIAAGVTLAASAGAPYVGTVATVADGNPGDTAGALTAMIAWGDGQSSLAVVTPDPHEAGTFDIGGTHEYTATGTYAVTVQVVDADGNMSTASGTATVTEPALVATAVTISPSVAVPYTGAVLTFTGGSLDPLSAFSATIDWGDGTTTAGTIAPPTVPGGPFQVNGTHSYQAIGAYSVTATVTNSDGNSASAIDTANVSNMAATSRTVAASEGAAFDGIVATFTDAETELGASAFSATIDWGDGTTTVGTVAPDASVAGQFDVAGVHTFNAAGAPAVVVQIAGPAGAGTAVVVGSAFVADAPLSATADAVDATEGQAFTGLVAYFSDAGPAGSSSQYWALIGWGDGQVSAGAIAPDPTVPGRFDVSGTHIYEMNGSYSVSVQIVDVGGCTVATTGTASVTDAPLLASFGSVSALPGVVFSGTVATFTEGPSDPLSAFSATIDWGDGTSATATIIPPAAPGEPFQVDGTHAYESAGTYNIVVSVLDADGGSATATGAAQIASVAGTGHPINATAGDSFTEGVASFASADPAALPSQFTATIAWGDGHSSSGVVTDDPHSPGRFLVTGTHVYQSNGSFSVLVHVTDQSGGTASIASLAVVADAPLVVNVGVISPFLETPYNGVVATFREGPTDPLSVFSATIDWGDGTTTAGTVVAPATTGGPFQVEGAHNYQAIGAFAVVITVRNTDGNVVFATGTADVSQIAAAGTSIAVNQGATFNDVVATFTGTEPGLAATAISATIDWGDGTTSTGVVAADTSVVGQFDVTGAHAYAAAGAPGFTVRIVGPAGAGTAVVVGKAVVADIPLVATGASVTATKAQIFTGLVASFDGSFDTASDYTTTIDWGDGTTTAGTLALNGTTSDAFDILGTHAYGADGTYAVLVEVTSVDGGSTSATTTAVVTSAPLLVSFGTVSATLGTPYNGVVGSFTGGSSDEASAFSATINWGDGTTVAGVVTAPAAPGEPFQVLGTHVYQVVGDFVVTLTVHDADGQAASAAGSVDVTDMTGDGVPIMAVQGTAYFGRVATFTDPNAGLVAGNYSAVIHWGDGDSSTGVVLPAPGGNFVVTGTHTFDTPGAYDTLVTLVSPSGQSLAIAGTATATAAPLIAASAPVSATAGAGFQGEVATFGQAGVVSTSVFSATIDWGDGTTAAATIGQGPAVGQFTVTGGHSYASPGSYNTVTTIVDSNGTWATAVGTAEVSNMSATPQPVIATEGTSFNGVVATFTDPGQGLGASDFTANVVWGDGTSSAGSITVDPAVPGQFDVTATHAFAKSGTYATLVRITDPSDYRALVAGSATVAAVPLTATGLMATATEGHRFTGAVVTFSDPNPYAAASDFSASVVWADGQITVGTVTAASNVAGLFNVTATTVFNSTGSYSVTVQITDRSGSATSAVGLVQVAEAPLSVTAVAVSAAPGQAYNGWVAQFQKGPTDEAGSFSATIDWGDGTTTAGLVSGSAGPGGPFWVGGEHAYTVTGIYTVVVTVVDVDGTTASVTGAADVSNMTAAGFSLQGTQGTTLSGRVATVGAVSLGLQASDFTAAIDWGDGQTSAGTVVSDPTTPGGYAVTGSHVYVDSGDFTVSITVAAGLGDITTATTSVQIADAPITIGSQTITPVAGSAFNDVVATFTDANSYAQASNFSAAIDWGNGQASAGTVIADPLVSGQFDVTGGDTYQKSGVFTVKVSVVDQSGGTASTASEADVLDAPLAASNVTVAPTEGLTFNGIVATFADPNPYLRGSDFSATITWGNGDQSAGTIATGAQGTFEVLGSDTYDEFGTYAVLVQVTDRGDGSATAHSLANVADAPLSAGLPVLIQATEGNMFTGVVASFSDANPNANVNDLLATIDWGDGHTSNGTIAPNSSGGFDVSGTNAYAQYGQYAVAVSVHDAGGSRISLSNTAEVADATLSGTAQDIEASQNSPFTGSVAAFTDGDPFAAASQFTATINWGDGTITSGTVTTDPAVYGQFDVSGTHTYTVASSYPILVQVSDPGGSSTTVVSTALISSANVASELAFNGAAALFDGSGTGGSSSASTAFQLPIGSLSPLSPSANSGTAGTGSSGSSSVANSGLLTPDGQATIPTDINQHSVTVTHTVGLDYTLDETVTIILTQQVTGDDSAGYFSDSFAVLIHYHYRQVHNSNAGGSGSETFTDDESGDLTLTATATGSYRVDGTAVDLNGHYSVTQVESVHVGVSDTSSTTTSSGVGTTTDQLFMNEGGSDTNTYTEAGNFSTSAGSSSLVGASAFSDSSNGNFTAIETLVTVANSGTTVSHISASATDVSSYTETDYLLQLDGKLFVGGTFLDSEQGGDTYTEKDSGSTPTDGGFLTLTGGDSYSDNYLGTINQIDDTWSLNADVLLRSGSSAVYVGYDAGVLPSGSGLSGSYFLTVGGTAVSGSSFFGFLGATNTTTTLNGTEFDNDRASDSSTWTSAGSFVLGAASGSFTDTEVATDWSIDSDTAAISQSNSGVSDSGTYSSSDGSTDVSDSTFAGHHGTPPPTSITPSDVGPSVYIVGNFTLTEHDSTDTGDTDTGSFTSSATTSSDSGYLVSTEDDTSLNIYHDQGTATAVPAGSGQGGTTDSQYAFDERSELDFDFSATANYTDNGLAQTVSGTISFGIRGFLTDSSVESGTTVTITGPPITQEGVDAGTSGPTMARVDDATFSESEVDHDNPSIGAVMNYTQDQSGVVLAGSFVNSELITQSTVYGATDIYSQGPSGPSGTTGAPRLGDAYAGTLIVLQTGYSFTNNSDDGTFDGAAVSGTYNVVQMTRLMSSYVDSGEEVDVETDDGVDDHYTDGELTNSYTSSAIVGVFSPAGQSATFTLVQTGSDTAYGTDTGTATGKGLLLVVEDSPIGPMLAIYGTDTTDRFEASASHSMQYVYSASGDITANGPSGSYTYDQTNRDHLQFQDTGAVDASIPGSASLSQAFTSTENDDFTAESTDQGGISPAGNSGIAWTTQSAVSTSTYDDTGGTSWNFLGISSTGAFSDHASTSLGNTYEATAVYSPTSSDIYFSEGQNATSSSHEGGQSASDDGAGGLEMDSWSNDQSDNSTYAGWGSSSNGDTVTSFSSTETSLATSVVAGSSVSATPGSGPGSHYSESWSLSDTESATLNDGGTIETDVTGAMVRKSLNPKTVQSDSYSYTDSGHADSSTSALYQGTLTQTSHSEDWTSGDATGSQEQSSATIDVEPTGTTGSASFILTATDNNYDTDSGENTQTITSQNAANSVSASVTYDWTEGDSANSTNTNQGGTSYDPAVGQEFWDSFNLTLSNQASYSGNGTSASLNTWTMAGAGTMSLTSTWSSGETDTWVGSASSHTEIDVTGNDGVVTGTTIGTETQDLVTTRTQTSGSGPGATSSTSSHSTATTTATDTAHGETSESTYAWTSTVTPTYGPSTTSSGGFTTTTTGPNTFSQTYGALFVVCGAMGDAMADSDASVMILMVMSGGAPGGGAGSSGGGTPAGGGTGGGSAGTPAGVSPDSGSSGGAGSPTAVPPAGDQADGGGDLADAIGNWAGWQYGLDFLDAVDQRLDPWDQKIKGKPGQEGLASAVEGAIEGDFSDNTTYSAMAGQAIVGMLPGVGKVADVRDLAAALIHVAQEKEGSGLDLFFAVLAFVDGPGDAAKGAWRTTKRGLKKGTQQAVEEGAQGVGKQVVKNTEASRGAVKQATRQSDDAAQGVAKNVGQDVNATSKKGLGCFPAGTLIATSTGLRPIETIQRGDRVWAYDLIGSEWHLQRVLETFKPRFDGISVGITVADEKIVSTFEHPFWVVSGDGLEGRPRMVHIAPTPVGATTPGRWVNASDLKAGDVLLLRDGRREPVQAVNHKPLIDDVFNFTVEELASYAVGWNGVLVHNTNLDCAQSSGSGAPKSGPYRGKLGEAINPTQIDVYRGGTSLQVKPGEVKVGKDGLVQPTHGMSLETDPSGLGRFGGASRVKSIPDELQIIQRGKRDTHFEIVPKSPMTPERFQELVNQIELAPPI